VKLFVCFNGDDTFESVGIEKAYLTNDVPEGITINTISYDINSTEVTGEPPEQSLYIDGGKNVTAPAMPDGVVPPVSLSFSGKWNTKADGSGSSYEVGKEIIIPAGSGDITLYAIWDDVKKEVTYDLNEVDGTTVEGTIPETAPVKIGTTFEAAAAPTATKPVGLIFKGWNTEADGSGDSYESGDEVEMPEAGITLYAVWEKILVDSVTLSTADGVTTISEDLGTLEIVADVKPENAFDLGLEWTMKVTSGPAVIAKIAPAEDTLSATLTAQLDGWVEVTATAADGSEKFNTIKIVIENQTGSIIYVEGVTVSSKDNVSKIKVGETLQMSSAVTPVEAAQDVTWSVNPADKAKISTAGLLTGVAAGDVTVTATTVMTKDDGKTFATGSKVITIEALPEPDSDEPSEPDSSPDSEDPSEPDSSPDSEDPSEPDSSPDSEEPTEPGDDPGSGLEDFTVVAELPLTPTHVIGTDWYGWGSNGTDDIETPITIEQMKEGRYLVIETGSAVTGSLSFVWQGDGNDWGWSQVDDILGEPVTGTTYVVDLSAVAPGYATEWQSSTVLKFFLGYWNPSFAALDIKRIYLATSESGVAPPPATPPASTLPAAPTFSFSYVEPGPSFNDTSPADGSGAAVPYRTYGNSAILRMSGDKVADVIAKATDGEATIDLSGVSGAEKVSLARNALYSIANSGNDVVLVLPGGKMTIASGTAKTIALAAKSGNVTFILAEVDTAKLSAVDQAKFAKGDIIRDFAVMYDRYSINYDGGIGVSINYEGEAAPSYVWIRNAAGKFSKVDCTYNEEIGAVEF
jgi:hypothetical protein